MFVPLKAKLIYAGVALLLCAATAHSAEDVLARFKGGQISVPELEAAIANKDRFTRRELATPEGKLSFLRELENYELLVLEAERRGYANHPAVIDAKRNAATLGMLADLNVDPASIPAAEVASEYASRLARAEKPAKPPRLSRVEGALREELAQQRFEQAKSALAKRLRDQHKPEIKAELVDLVRFESPGRADRPAGFPAAPPDPRAPAPAVEADGI